VVEGEAAGACLRLIDSLAEEAIMARLTIEVDLPPEITVTAYRRHDQGHGFEVSWPLPSRCCCDRCHREQETHLDVKDTVQVVRDLDIWGQPSFWIYQPAYQRCAYCNHRQHVIPPFKRKDVSYTYRFEQQILRLLIGSNEEEVARRLGISAEMVGLIVHHQLTDAKAKEVDPQRRITDVGIDELSLKKRHKLYCTILTDLTDPTHPEVLAVAEGRDEAAARKCLEKLGEAQRRQVQAYRADMAPAFHNACRQLLPNAKPVVDRFHVAKQFNEAIDGLRKKNQPGVQGATVQGRAQGVPRADVGVSQGSQRAVQQGQAEAGRVVCQAAAVADAARVSAAVPEDL
jgi:transposase